MSTKRFGVLIVGNSLVGKRTLLGSYIKKKYTEHFEIFERWIEDVNVKGQSLELCFRLATGKSEFAEICKLFYQLDSDLVLLCFVINEPEQFNDVLKKWIQELMKIKHFSPKASIILVATKVDLRNDPTTIKRLAAQGLLPLSAADGQAMAKHIDASAYVECSAKYQKTLENLMEIVAVVALRKSERCWYPIN